MKILMTGSTGYLGKIIALNLKKNEHVLFTIGNKSCDVFCDLSTSLPQIFESTEIVIHVAGKAHIKSNFKEKNNSFYFVNVIGTNNLLKGLDNLFQLPKRFIFISSVSVYGEEQGVNINENSPLTACDNYGLSKIQAERLVLDWCQKNNVICTILRLPLIVSENPPGNLGTMINGIKKGYYFNIAGGLSKKSMVLAEDVANILLKASEIGGIYNLTDGYHPNFYELSNAIANQIGKSRPFNLPYIIARSIALIGDFLGINFPFNSKKFKKITSNLTFDDTKAREVLGWNPNKVLDFYIKQ